MNSMLISALVDMKWTSAVPSIRKAYESGTVDESFNGDFSDVLEVRINSIIKRKIFFLIPRSREWKFQLILMIP